MIYDSSTFNAYIFWKNFQRFLSFFLKINLGLVFPVILLWMICNHSRIICTLDTVCSRNVMSHIIVTPSLPLVTLCHNLLDPLPPPRCDVICKWHLYNNNILKRNLLTKSRLISVFEAWKLHGRDLYSWVR